MTNQLLVELEMANKEIEKLNNTIIDLHSVICEKQNKINRLNNIINELEKMLENPYNVDCINQNKVFLNKLQELKEGK